MSNKLPSELVTKVTLIAAKAGTEAGVDAFLKEMGKYERKKKSEMVKKVKDSLRGYRGVKKALKTEIELTEEEKVERRFSFFKDCMETPSNVPLKSEKKMIEDEKIRVNNLIKLKKIEYAMQFYKEEGELACNEEEKRRYRVIKALYIDDTPMSVQELAEAENVSEKTIYRDIGIACKMLAFYINGIE